MNDHCRRAFAIAATLALTATLCPPAAGAVAPPPIDDSLLPKPSAPAPPRPTRQLEACTAMTFEPARDSSDTHSSGIDKSALWRLSRGKGQRIGLIGTGIQPHPRLSHVVGGGDYVSYSNGTQDCDGHGTIIAGLIAAAVDPNDPTGFSGIAPDATLISIRQSSTKFGAAAKREPLGLGDLKTLAMAVRTAADLGASVINISTVACVNEPPDDRALGAALAYAVDIKDAVVVTAAGNVSRADQPASQRSHQNDSMSPQVVVSPAWYDDYVLTVGSVSTDGQPSAFSLHGPWVDVATVGESIVSLNRSGTGVGNRIAGRTGAAEIAGTSYAAAVVAGLVALIRSRFPRLSARQVMARIQRTAQKPSADRDLAVGDGIVDPLAALSDDATRESEYRTNTRTAPDLSHNPAPSRTMSVQPAAIAAAVCIALMATIAIWPQLRGRARRSEHIHSD